MMETVRTNLNAMKALRKVRTKRRTWIIESRIPPPPTPVGSSISPRTASRPPCTLAKSVNDPEPRYALAIRRASPESARDPISLSGVIFENHLAGLTVTANREHHAESLAHQRACRSKRRLREHPR